MDVRVPTASGSHAGDENSIRREVIPTQLAWVPDMKKSDKFNSSGYLDMTAYLALKNVEREEAEKQQSMSNSKRKKRKKKRRKTDKK